MGPFVNVLNKVEVFPVNKFKKLGKNWKRPKKENLNTCAGDYKCYIELIYPQYHALISKLEDSKKILQ